MASNELPEEYAHKMLCVDYLLKEDSVSTYYTIDEVCAMDKPMRLKVAKAIWGL